MKEVTLSTNVHGRLKEKQQIYNPEDVCDKGTNHQMADTVTYFIKIADIY